MQPEPERAPQRLGEFTILAELARGGAGVVYRARHPRLGELALKVLIGGAAAPGRIQERFLVEARAVQRLQHPAIVSVREVGQAEGVPYLALELVPGGSLADRLEGGPLPPRLAVELLLQVSEALEHAHGQGILHRDVKPANVLLDSSGRARLTDFGLAKLVDASSGPTQSGTFLGTVHYMAPEQLSAAKQVDARADVYSLGATLYAALCGQAPFADVDGLEVFVATSDTPPRALSELVPGLDPQLEAICLRCLEKDPARRYPSAAAVGGDLRAWLEGRPNARPGPRRWAGALVGAGLVLAASAAGGLLLTRGEDPEPAPAESGSGSAAAVEPPPPAAQEEAGGGSAALLARAAEGSLDPAAAGAELADLARQDPAAAEPALEALEAARDALHEALTASLREVTPASERPALELALEEWARLRDSAPPPQVSAPVYSALERLRAGVLRGRPVWEGPSSIELMGGAQTASVDAGALRAAGAAAHALGAAGPYPAALRLRVQDALSGYLWLEFDPQRALPAALAVVHLELPDALAALRHSSLRFGPAGPFRALGELLAERLRAPNGDLETEVALLRLSSARGLDPQVEARAEVLLEEHPRSPELWLALGSARARQRDFSGGAEALERAVELNPLAATAWARLATALTQLDREEDALEAGRRAVDLEPESSEARHALALGLGCAGRDRRAAALMEDLLQRDPFYVPALFRRCLAYSRAGRAEEAGEVAARVLVRHPWEAACWNLLARQEEDPGARLRILERHASVVADPLPVRIQMVRLCEELGRLEQAEEILQGQTRDRPQDPRGWMELALFRARRGAHDEAWRLTERVVSLRGGLAGLAWGLLGQALLEGEHRQRALRAFDLGLAADPQEARCLQGRAILLTVLELPGAGEAHDAAVARGWDMVRTLRNRALHREEHGDPRGALADLQRALELDDRQPALWALSGRMRARLGDYEGALADAERGLSLQPDQPQAREVQARALYHLGRYAEAVASYEELRAHLRVDFELGRAYLALGELETARRLLEASLESDPPDAERARRLLAEIERREAGGEE